MKKSISKAVCALLTGCMVIGSLVGCGGSKDSGGSAAAANPTESAAASGPITGIKIGTSESWETLTPFRTTQSQYASMVRLIYDRLAYQTADNEYIPQVAKSWEVDDDGVTWNVEIYDYVEDSEGNHITASDIVWMLEESMKQ